MKKIIMIMSFIIFSIFLSSCDKESEINRITFMCDDEIIEVIEIRDNYNIYFPIDPEKEGYMFDGWYYLDEKIDNNYIVTEDMTIVAKFVENGPHTHKFTNDRCICGSYYNELLFNLYGDNSFLYHNDIENPYGIDLDIYGSDVYVLFYQPNLSYTDPYENIDKKDFYSNYEVASSYEDSYFRTKHNLMSGDITPQGHIPPTGAVSLNNKDVRVSTATYVLDEKGNYLAYVINNLNGEDSIIYYGGGYTSINEVAAYLLAFGEVPVNNKFDKNSKGRKSSVEAWGEYGRCNMGEFYGNNSNYPYEPSLPKNDTLYYCETDFGTLGGYSNVSPSKTYVQTIYNNGKTINRGAARFCFIADRKIKSIDERHVFYTYNHYNDFQEYLNYLDGFGTRFGNESSGNQYCANANDYYNSKYEITNYVEAVIKCISELEK